LWIHYPSWDLSSVYLVDSRTRKVIQKLVPVDLHKNANGKRAFHAPVAPVRSPLKPNDFVDQLPPQMQKLVKERQQEHLPPAYLPQTEF
jgi:hypothetical protein